MKNHHIQSFKDSTLSFTMRHIEGGTFDMGSNDEEAYGDEKPVHAVTVKDFKMAEFPVTQALWSWVMKDTDMPDPAYFKGHNHPVEQVSWDDITEGFLPRLNELTKGLPLHPEGSVYALPTEAQWEYAAKGGIHQKDFLFKYAGSNKLNEVGWYDENSHSETKPVGLKTPNLLGLYDMSGNVWEWCNDWFGSYEDVIKQSKKDSAPGAILNPIDVQQGTNRVLRGGAWLNFARNCRSTFRYDHAPSARGNDIGFRLVFVYPSV